MGNRYRHSRKRSASNTDPSAQKRAKSGDPALKAANAEQGCVVCGKEQAPYRCPQCKEKKVRYCSVPCFKKHKESEHAANQQPSDQEKAKEQRADLRLIDVPDSPGQLCDGDEILPRVKPEVLVALKGNTEIREILKDREVQEAIVLLESAAEADTGEPNISGDQRVSRLHQLLAGPRADKISKFCDLLRRHCGTE
eukprot:Clim_evm8s154 gene=Clim_evmTU8s154